MSGKIVVLGYGPVGKGAVMRLAGEGRQVVVAQRKAPGDLPPGVGFVACDVLDAASVRAVAVGAAQVVAAFGLAYDGAVWRKSWPKAMANVLDACEARRRGSCSLTIFICTGRRQSRLPKRRRCRVMDASPRCGAR